MTLLPIREHQIAHQLGNGPSRRAYTTGQVARIFKTAPRTVVKWVDAGKLHGYVLPGSNDRRILERDLIAFAVRHGMEYLLGGIIRPLLYVGGLEFGEGTGVDNASSWLAAGYLIAARSYQNVAFDCLMGAREAFVGVSTLHRLSTPARTLVILNEDAAVEETAAFLKKEYDDVVCLQHPVTAEAVLAACKKDRVVTETLSRLAI